MWSFSLSPLPLSLKKSYCFVFTLPLKGSTLKPLFGTYALPASLLLHFGTIIKYTKGDLNTSSVVQTVSLITQSATVREHVQCGFVGQ